MGGNTVKSILNIAAAACAILAAGLWWKASVVFAPPSASGGAWGGATITVTDSKGRPYDPFDTAVLQSRWNKWAAMAASAAALLQGVALLIPETCASS